jgi:pyruvate/2-oxoglutarate dehydrogenase complex dihydrolipoamide acyltransferase (E2) component
VLTRELIRPEGVSSAAGDEGLAEAAGVCEVRNAEEGDEEVTVGDTLATRGVDGEDTAAGAACPSVPAPARPTEERTTTTATNTARPRAERLALMGGTVFDPHGS